MHPADLNKLQSLYVILGPTASGKTSLAAALAAAREGGINSADSRQVYRRMDIGTGKDHASYIVDGKTIPVHLTDICEPGEEYNIYRYQNDFLRAYHDITIRGKQPILCGGSGLYLEAVLKPYPLPDITGQEKILMELEGKSDEELVDMLRSYRRLHNFTDTETRDRTIKAILIERSSGRRDIPQLGFPLIPRKVFGIGMPRETVRERITRRLQQRLEAGMIRETESLLAEGIPPERLIRYGLEYKYLTLYLTGSIGYEAMFSGLNTAIHQFAKRQMTWFRRMERQGIPIRWLDGLLPAAELVRQVTA